MLLLWILPVEVIAATYESGKVVAMGSVQAVQWAVRDTAALTAAGVPVSERPPEAVLYDKDRLQTAATQEKGRNETLKTIHGSQRGRLEYTFDLDASLQKTEAGETIEMVETGGSQTFNKVCSRSGLTYTQSCKRERIVTIEVIPEVGHHNPRFCIGHWKSAWRGTKWYCGGCRGGEYVIDQHKQVTILRDQWVGCEGEEALRDEGAAELEEVRAGPVENPRIIEGEPIEGEIWEETRVYRIGTNTFDQCASLRALGCTDQGGRCVKIKTLTTGQVICLEYEHTFRCPLGSSKSRSPKDLKLSTTESPSYEGNKNMAESLARIEALKQAAQSMQTNGNAVISIFSGEDKRCTTNFGGAFKDCCRKAGGVGVRMGLSTQCTADERTLADWRGQGRCVFVGQRKKNDMFGMNLSKEYVYCCFPSKLARAIQQGGRAQLGIGWGTAESPNCRGFTPEGLQRIDWSRLDLSEVLEDMARSAQQTSEVLQRDYAQKQRALAPQPEKARRKLIQEQAQAPSAQTPSAREARHDLAY
jgi:hypothetical protein